jgi:hypothetical protein
MACGTGGEAEAAQAALAATMAAMAPYQYAQIQKTDACLDPLRGEPRCQAIVRALEYPP